MTFRGFFLILVGGLVVSMHVNNLFFPAKDTVPGVSKERSSDSPFFLCVAISRVFSRYLGVR